MTKKKPSSYYLPYPRFVMRTPMLPFSDKQTDIADLFKYSQDAVFKEAIYLASPVLYDEMLKWHQGVLTDKKEIDKLAISLLKYYTRMQTRCTPYGLFAGCGVGTWGANNEIILANQRERHTRLDMNFMCSLAQQLQEHPDIKPLLRFYPNSSIYNVGYNIRYTEYRYVNGRRLHELSSVSDSPYLQQVLQLASSGAYIHELARSIQEEDISEAEAFTFVHELIANQLLVSELEPAVTGDEFIHQLIQTLLRVNASTHSTYIAEVAAKLQETQKQVEDADTRLGNEVAHYRNICESLKLLNKQASENQLFQTDLFSPARQATLQHEVINDLQQAIHFLDKFYQKEEYRGLKNFAENFRNRYEDREVPLLEALDTETGIGYAGKDTLGINPLIDNLPVGVRGEGATEIKWTRQQEMLHKRLLDAYKNEEYSVSFSEEDIRSFDNTSNVMPDSLSIMFRITDANKIYLQNCGGASATNLLARFAHGSPEIHEMLKDISAHEHALHHKQVLAEIVHLPESRIGNILLRPVLRNFEIPYLGKSALPLQNQIRLQDLMVSVKGSKIILRSKELDAEIIPRLSSAHNFTTGLPVYQFLCELQLQYFDKTGFGFHWGALGNSYKFLPRAEYRNVILEKARWQLNKRDWQLLLDTEAADYLPRLQEWRSRWKMPQYVSLSDGDNELLVDFKNPLSLQMLVQTIKKRDRVVFEEFLLNPAEPLVKDEKGQGYTHEFIGVLLRNPDAETQALPQLTMPKKKLPAAQQQRAFSVGSEWLYYKIYCGVKTSNQLLADEIYPLMQEFISQQRCIDKFFFVRYHDPELHIRLRLHIPDPEKTGYVINAMHQALAPWLEHGLLSKIQTDTYWRELERYGGHLIQEAETLFYYDSSSILNMLSHAGNTHDEHLCWRFALRAADNLLDLFDYNRQQKLLFLEQLKDSFVKEHGAGKGLRQGLNDKFRDMRSQVEASLEPGKDKYPNAELVENLISWRSHRLQPIASYVNGQIDAKLSTVGRDELMSSYLHMMINRIFKSRQRTYEMLIYEMLYRHHKSFIGREKYQGAQEALNETLIASP